MSIKKIFVVSSFGALLAMTACSDKKDGNGETKTSAQALKGPAIDGRWELATFSCGTEEELGPKPFNSITVSGESLITVSDYNQLKNAQNGKLQKKWTWSESTFRLEYATETRLRLVQTNEEKVKFSKGQREVEADLSHILDPREVDYSVTEEGKILTISKMDFVGCPNNDGVMVLNKVETPEETQARLAKEKADAEAKKAAEEAAAAAPTTPAEVITVEAPKVEEVKIEAPKVEVAPKVEEAPKVEVPVESPEAKVAREAAEQAKREADAKIKAEKAAKAKAAGEAKAKLAKEKADAIAAQQKLLDEARAQQEQQGPKPE